MFSFKLKKKNYLFSLLSVLFFNCSDILGELFNFWNACVQFQCYLDLNLLRLIYETNGKLLRCLLCAVCFIITINGFLLETVQLSGGGKSYQNTNGPTNQIQISSLCSFNTNATGKLWISALSIFHTKMSSSWHATMVDGEQLVIDHVDKSLYHNYHPSCNNGKQKLFHWLATLIETR